jgi:hypothetical protein
MDIDLFNTNLSRNIDIGVLREKKFQCLLVIWGKFYEHIQGWQADFRIATRGA